MSKTYNMVGEVYSKLTVIEKVESGKRGSRWKCICECGNEKIVYRADLVTRHQLSCGCLKWKGKPTHGLFGTSIYNCYRNMLRRCDDPKNNSYKDYGDRGITYCEKWLTIDGFLDDMLPTYVDGLTLERKDVNGNYCKDNCCWVDRKSQAYNRRSNHIIEVNDEKMTIAQAAEKYGVNNSNLKRRLLGGWGIEKALDFKYEKEMITFNDTTKTIAEFAEERGMTYHHLKKRLMRGWSVERAITQPLRKGKS